MRLHHVVPLLITASACFVARTGTNEPERVLLAPGHRDIRTESLANRSASFTYFVRQAGADTGERRYTTGASEFNRVDGGKTILTHFRYAPPQVSEDSLWTDAESARPRREWLRVGKKTIELQYDGRSVHRRVTNGDSLTASDTTFAEPVFAFNQAETLIRALPLRRGYQRIVPLYSEIDAKVEYDTITVVGPNVGIAGSWTIRFADPAIVQQWIIEENGRDVLSLETRPRRSPVVLRRVDAVLPPER
jgi:hypothetical protein